jgi:hypothetical protein
MGPQARPSPGPQPFNLASPRPGGGPPSGRPTSELLGSATFQTPEGLFFFFLLFHCRLLGALGTYHPQFPPSPPQTQV